MTMLRNAYVSVLFDNAGAMTSLCCLSTGRELLAPGAKAPFAAWTDFTAEYGTKPTEPKEICAVRRSPATASLRECTAEADRAVLVYDMGGVAARLTVRLDGIGIRMSLTLVNESGEEIRLLPVFPAMDGLDFDEAAGAKMLAMNQGGYVAPCWQHRGGFYGTTFQHSAQFGCLFDGETCMGFYIKDAEFGCKDFSYQKPDFEVRWAPGRVLAPGEGTTLPEVVLMVYAGSWMRTARAYGDWFRQATNPDPTPDWVRNAASYAGAWFVKREGDEPGDGFYQTMDTFEELPGTHRLTPVELKEYAFYCELSSELQETERSVCGSGRRIHTDGWNEVRRDMGGAEALRRGINSLDRKHRRVMLYIEGLITPPESELYVHKPEAADWIFRDPDGVSRAAYTDVNWRAMCPGSDWQDHLAEMAARLVRETDCDGIRLDCLGGAFTPCWNPSHGHESPFDYNRWLRTLIEKVASAVRAVKPDVLLSTEYAVDYLAVHFNHALFQTIENTIWHSMKEPVPLCVALPHYRLNSWNGGAVAQALRLLPMGRTQHRRWHEVCHAVLDIYHDGEVLPDPELSREDAQCRRMRSGAGDLLILARPDAPENPSGEVWREAAEEIALKQDGAETVVSLPLEYEPAELFELDAESGSVRAVPYGYDGATLSIRTTSAFCALYIRREKGAAFLECRAERRESGAMELAVTSPSLAAPVDASLEIEGFAGAECIPIRVPGKIRIDVPEGTKPGVYRAILTGEGIVSTLKLLEVSGE